MQALWQFGAPEAEFLGGIGPAIDVLEGNAVRLRAVGTAIVCTYIRRRGGKNAVKLQRRSHWPGGIAVFHSVAVLQRELKSQ